MRNNRPPEEPSQGSWFTELLHLRFPVSHPLAGVDLPYFSRPFLTTVPCSNLTVCSFTSTLDDMQRDFVEKELELELTERQGGKMKALSEQRISISQGQHIIDTHACTDVHHRAFRCCYNLLIW